MWWDHTKKKQWGWHNKINKFCWSTNKRLKEKKKKGKLLKKKKEKKKKKKEKKKKKKKKKNSIFFFGVCFVFLFCVVSFSCSFPEDFSRDTFTQK